MTEKAPWKVKAIEKKMAAPTEAGVEPVQVSASLKCPPNAFQLFMQEQQL